MRHVCEKLSNGKLESLGIILWLLTLSRKVVNTKFVF